MKPENILHKDDRTFKKFYQLKIPLNIEYIIPTNDSVRLLSQFVEEMDLSDSYLTYSRIRVNRSLQAESSFAQIKQDMNFKRFMCRGKKNVLAESILLALAHNVNKLHHKIQSECNGRLLFEIQKMHKYNFFKAHIL